MPKVSKEVRELRKNEILEAALHCFSSKGYHLTTVDDIVKACGLSKGAVYHYFKSKEEIFLSLLQRRSDAVLQELAEKLSTIPSPLEKLRYWIRNDSTFDLKKKKFMYVHIESWMYATDAPHVREQLKKSFDAFFQLTEDIIREGQQLGEIKEDIDPYRAASMFWSLHDGIWFHVTIGYDEEKLEQRIEEMERTMLAYLTCA